MRMLGLDVVGGDDQTPSGKLSTWDIIKKEAPTLENAGEQIYNDTQKKPGAPAKKDDKKPGGGGPSGPAWYDAMIVAPVKVWHALVSVAAASAAGLAYWKLRK